jgi:hypothetical protein
MSWPAGKRGAVSSLVGSFALAGLAALAAPATACGPRPAAGSAGAAAQDDDASAVTLQVVSHNARAVELSLDSGSGERRLGVVRGQGRTTFSIPWREVAGGKRLRLSARALGGGPAVSSAVEVTPGGRVAWTLESNLTFSSATAD